MGFNRAIPDQTIRSDEYNQNLDKTVATDEPRVVEVRHTFNPSTPGAPFNIGANAQAQLVSGLNADTVDGRHAAEIVDHLAWLV